MASSDNELRQQLKRLGVDVGPITDTTRELYKRVLQKKKKSSSAKFSREPCGSSTVKSGRGNIKPVGVVSGAYSNAWSSTGKSASTVGHQSRRERHDTYNVQRESGGSKSVSSASNSRYSAGKRSASGSNQPSEPKRPRLDVYDKSTDESEEEDMEITVIHAEASPVKPKQTPPSPLYPRLYPTLPEEVDGDLNLTPKQNHKASDPAPLNSSIDLYKQQPSLFEPTSNKSPEKVQSPAVPRFNSPTNVRIPSSGSGLSLSPPSPTPSVDSTGGGLMSIVTGFIGAGVRKIVHQIQGSASPRSSIRAASKRHRRKVSFGSASKASSPIPSRASNLDASPSDSSMLQKDRESIPNGSIDLKILGQIHSPASPIHIPDSPEPSASPTSSQAKDDHGTYDWELMPSDVEICKKADGSLWKLGKGGFGEVFKGLKDSVDEVAVKVIRIQNSPIAKEQFKREIDIISKLRHRHILQFYGACVQPSSLYMVTELMQTDLFSVLRHNIRYLWSGLYGKEVLVGIASGLHYLHSRRPPVVHRDIKSPNILLMDGIAKIADVGIARTKSESDMTAQKGFTVAWAAPEVVYRKRATEKIDIWSLGIIMWEVVSGKMPHVGHLQLPAQAPPPLRTLYNLCVCEDPNKRPGAAEVVKHLKAIE